MHEICRRPHKRGLQGAEFPAISTSTNEPRPSSSAIRPEDGAVGRPFPSPVYFYYVVGFAGVLKSGGGGGIRTPETLSSLTVFKTAAFNHSATPPQ